METLHPPPAAPLPPLRQALVLALLAVAQLLGRLAARLAAPRAARAAAAVEREVAVLRAGEGRALAVYEGGRLVGVLPGIDRL